jgi:dTDP-4-amino-4,6-dideoxygalactose transaminase
LQAAVGLGQLDDFERRLAHQRRLWAVYRERLADVPRIRLVPFDVGAGVCPLWIDAEVEGRDDLHGWLLARAIETRPYWRPLHTQPPYRAPQDGFPVATRIGASALWLPSALSLDKAGVDRVGAEIVAWASRNLSQD